jgi:hypothetical protein
MRLAVVGILLLIPAGAAAQSGSASLLLQSPAYATWSGAPATTAPAVRLPTRKSGERLRHGLIGGVAGAAAGVIVCTVISTIADDSADPGLSTCTFKGYLLTGGIGFALGFGIGFAI